MTRCPALSEHLGADSAKAKGSAVPPSPMLGYSEAAAFLGLKVGTLRSMVSRRQVPHVRLSEKLVRFLEADLIEYLSARRVPVAVPDKAINAEPALRVVAGDRGRP